MCVCVCPVLSSRIDSYSPDLSETEADESIEKALQLWAKVTPLTFARVSRGPADIVISFGRQCEYSNL